MKIFIFLVSTLFVMHIISAETPVQKKEKPKKSGVAVMDLVAKGMDEMAVVALSDRLRSELINTNQFDVMERGQMDDIMKEQGFQSSGACTDEACIVEMGQLLGVDKMLAGSIGKLGAMYMINLRMIDMATGKIVKTVTQDARVEIEELPQYLEIVAQKLAGIQTASPAPAVAAKPAPAATTQTAKTSTQKQDLAKTAPEPEKVEKKKGGHGVLYGIIASVVLGGGGAAAYFVVANANKEEEPGTVELPGLQNLPQPPPN